MIKATPEQIQAVAEDAGIDYVASGHRLSIVFFVRKAASRFLTEEEAHKYVIKTANAIRNIGYTEL